MYHREIKLAIHETLRKLFSVISGYNFNRALIISVPTKFKLIVSVFSLFYSCCFFTNSYSLALLDKPTSLSRYKTLVVGPKASLCTILIAF